MLLTEVDPCTERLAHVSPVSPATRTQTKTVDVEIDPVRFESGEFRIAEEDVAKLRSVLDPLRQVDHLRVVVEGHTDNVPIATARFPSNWELSVGRAIAVVRQLERQGIAISRMRAVGYADTQPMESNATAEGRAANRRVELLLKQQVKG